ncbi:hypothetical protein [Deinococcus multiflagellatus]|uniref:ATP-dependent DNA ligase family profile domain-containing protein n=1 Tax=Deinococcus multiflagellatus TaxID=1656887 RepID=A0ABW1ZPP7_9DEIO
MQKILSLYARNYDTDRRVRDEVVPGAEWVLAGEGVATRKWDGTSCLVRAGRLYRRYDAKKGRTPPPDFEPAQPPTRSLVTTPAGCPWGKGQTTPTTARRGQRRAAPYPTAPMNCWGPRCRATRKA